MEILPNFIVNNQVINLKESPSNYISVLLAFYYRDKKGVFRRAYFPTQRVGFQQDNL